MQEPVLIKLLKNGELFSPPFEINEEEEIAQVFLRNKKRALSKMYRALSVKSFLIEQGGEKEKIFQNRIMEYRGDNNEVFLPLLEKVIKKEAKEKGINLPLGELYIIAPPPEACRVIFVLKELSRLFTVISPVDASGKIYDELYFKYGCIIRQMPIFNNDVRSDSAVLRLSGEKIPAWIKSVSFDLCSDEKRDKRSIKLEKIRVRDSFTEKIESLWGGKAGTDMFSLFGRIPDKDAKMSFNEKADKIFLLDTSAF